MLEQAAADAEISRLYDGTHYEHDIAAGSAVGRSMVSSFVRWPRCGLAHGVRTKCKQG